MSFFSFDAKKRKLKRKRKRKSFPMESTKGTDMFWLKIQCLLLNYLYL